MEIWEDIEGFEGKYQISIKSRIKSLNYNNTGKEKILKPAINKQGHLEIVLNKNNKHYYRMVSRLVIETFTNKKLTKNDIVMYKDQNKTNCSLDNMYLITRGQRQEITYDLEHRYRPKYEYYGEYLPTKEISKRIGIDSQTIRRRITRQYWSIYECEIPIAIQNKKGG